MTKIAIITARANSKGISGKNLRSVGGVSLVGRAIQAAKETGLFSQIIVTTDGEAIAEESRSFGARVVLRPPELSSDTAKSIDAVCHALSYVGIEDGICVLLQPTSPLRAADDIREALTQYEREQSTTVVSVCESEHHPQKSFVMQDGVAKPLFDIEMMEMPRQLLPKAYRPNGAIYINKVSDLIKTRSFFTPPVGIYLMPASRSVDIDTEHDLVLANILIGDQHNAS